MLKVCAHRKTVAQDHGQVVAVSDSNHLVPWVPTWHSSTDSSTGFRITKPPTCSRRVTYPNIGREGGAIALQRPADQFIGEGR